MDNRPPGQPPYGPGNPPPPSGYPPQPGQPQGYPPQQPPGQPPYGYPQQPPGYGGYPPPYNQPPKKRGMPVWGWIILGVVGLLIVACVVGGIAIFGVVSNAKADGEKTLDQFMQAAASGNLDSAYSYVSPTITKQELQTQFIDVSSAYLPDYSKLTSNNFNVNSTNGSTTMSMSGTVTYKTKGTGPFTAQLENVNGKWRIVSIDIKPPS